MNRFWWLGCALVLVGCGDKGSTYSEEESEPCAVFWDCERGEICNEAGFCVSGDEEDPDECVDLDEDGYGEGCSLGEDCDDFNFFRNPALEEVCNGADDNCDFLIDENGVCDEACEDECVPGTRECSSDTSWRECRTLGGCDRWLALVHCEQACEAGQCVGECNDFDGDGYGENCPAGPDCDDRNPFAFPGNREVCDGYDNDCDGVSDQGGVCDEPCPEACPEGSRRCQGNGFQICGTDQRGCLDWSTLISCRGQTACEAGFCVEQVACVDIDGDGSGRGCQGGADCDDTDRNISPRAVEVCDGVDNNCSGVVDSGLGQCPAQWCSGQLHDTVGTARILTRGASGSGYVCPGRDALWDLGQIGANTAVVVAAQWAASKPTDLEVSLLFGTGLQAVHTTSAPGVGFTAATGSAGRYFLRVRASSGSPAAYSIGWGLGSDDCGLDDHEPNNSPSTPATSLFPGRVIQGGICPGDLDFYALPSVGTGETISVALASGANGGRLLVEVWHNGQAITPDQSRPDAATHTHSRFDMPGDYVVAVRGINPRISGPYRLAVSVGAPSACSDDNREQNDRLSQGTPINGASITGTLCPGDLDWFLLGDRAEGSMVDLSLEFNGNSANLDAYLFRDTINGLLQVALTDTAPERLPTRINNSGTYYVLVIGRDTLDTATYTLRR